MKYQGLDIRRLNHDCFVVSGSKVIYFDPFKISGDLPTADLILVSHDHYDHFSAEDINKIAGPGSTLVAPKAVMDQADGIEVKNRILIAPGKEEKVGGVMIKAISAYGVNKFKSPGVPFHPKEKGYVGFVVRLDGVTLYHTGDSDVIPEMRELGPIDVAFLPVSGTYVMTAEEAAEAVDIIKPKLAIPMHYGAIVGSDSDAKRFKELAKVPVEII
jgi:L-ascorbate metabolism protein UlaG (beta-lactamase superfamily)